MLGRFLKPNTIKPLFQSLKQNPFKPCFNSSYLFRCFASSSMDIVPIEKLRNIGISAHIDSGKTTVTERILYYTGRIKAIHEVRGKDGVGAKMDSMELEREKGITIQSAATYTHWGDYRINIIDTPGHVDFTVEVERALRVLDGAILILCGVAGVQSQSITVDRQMRRYNIPRLCFINKLDRQSADAYRVVEDLRNKIHLNCAMVMLPIGSESNFKGTIDIIKRKAIYYEGKNGDNVVEKEIPNDMKDIAEEKRKELVEKLAEVDDLISEKFIMEEDPSNEELYQAIRRTTIGLKFAPVFVGSAYKNAGIQPLLDGVVKYLPSPKETKQMAFDLNKTEKDEETGKLRNAIVKLYPDINLPLVAFAFKLDEGKFGQLTYLRIYQGLFKRGEIIVNTREKKSIKVPRLVRMHSNDMEDVNGVGPGEIVAMFGVECNSGDTFTSDRIRYSLSNMYIPETVISFAVKNKNSKDLENFTKALKRFQREDPTFKVTYNHEKNETLINGMGELHLQIYLERIRREYHCEVEVSPPRVNYRECIQQRADFNYLYKKQSGGQGLYAKVIGYIEPLPPNGEVRAEFVNKLVGLNILPEYVPAIEKGFMEAMEEGKISGHKVQVYSLINYVFNDGQYHPVDSSELAFRTAAKYAFSEAFKNANPTILEPVMKVEVVIPEEFQGVVIGGLNRRKGEIRDTEMKGNSEMTITANVPLSNMFGYSIELRQCTQGRGEFTMEYSHIQKAPQNAVKKLAEEYSKRFQK